MSTSDVGYYVYGIVSSDVELTEQERGVGDGTVELVDHGDVKALVSPIPVNRPIGEPADLMAHEKTLNRVATSTAVLPIRFGSVVASRETVADELLATNHDEFAAALADMRGRVEYVVRARFVDQAVLAEVMSEVPAIRELRDQISGQPLEMSGDQQVRLGELIAAAIEAKRAVATNAIVGALEFVVVASSIREPSHEFDAAHVAFLVETARAPEFDAAVEEIARQWHGYATVRLLGPLAPYDFVRTPSVTTEGRVT